MEGVRRRKGSSGGGVPNAMPITHLAEQRFRGCLGVRGGRSPTHSPAEFATFERDAYAVIVGRHI